PRPERDVEIGPAGDHRPPWVDDDEPRARLSRAVDERHEMEIRPRDVVAPDNDQPGVSDLLGPDAGDRAEGPDPRLGADPAAARPTIEQARAELVEEAEVHRPAGEHAVRARVVERQGRMRAEIGRASCRVSDEITIVAS